MLADNRIAQLASWDEPSLKAELQYLIDCDVEFNCAAIGFSTPEVNYILERADNLGGRAKKPRKQTRKQISALAVCKADDVWRLGDHSLHCGTAHLEQADAIIRRWQAEIGEDATDGLTGEPFPARERNRRDY